MVAKGVKHDEFGREVVDPTPLAVPAGWDRPESLAEMVQRMVRQEAFRRAVNSEAESFEEADDFDCSDEEEDWVSPYEIVDMAPLGPSEDASPPEARVVATPPEKTLSGPSKAPGGDSNGGGSPPA